jgi:cathepsin D
MLPLPLSATILLCLSVQQASAAPQSGITGQVAGQSMVLRKRALSPKSIDDWGVWAKEHREGLQAKYGDDDSLQKRGTGTNL